jgi:hypothetical protein
MITRIRRSAIKMFQFSHKQTKFFAFLHCMAYSLVNLTTIVHLCPPLLEFLELPELIAMNRICHEITVDHPIIHLNADHSFRLLLFLVDYPNPIELIRKRLKNTQIKIHINWSFLKVIRKVKIEALCLLKTLEIGTECDVDYDEEAEDDILEILRDVVNQAGSVLLHDQEDIYYKNMSGCVTIRRNLHSE